MRQPFSRRPISLIVGGFIALAVLLLWPPARVDAACGYGSSAKAERQAGSMFEHLEILSVDMSSHQTIPERQGRRPCSGPSCSGRNPSAPNTPIPPSLETGDRWLCACFCLEITTPDGCWQRLRSATPSPVNRASALERPPRSLPI
jgi:hypothetical protein